MSEPTIAARQRQAARLLGVDQHPRISHETEERILAVAQALADAYRAGLDSEPPLHEIECPACGATIRARMADG